VVPTPEPTDTFDLAAVSGRLLSGEVQEAIAELEARVALAPADMKAWTLLATAYRRAGDDPLALDAWLRAVDLGSGLGVNRARYEAATLLQARGDHGGAAVQLEAILADTAGAGALEADARLRLGRSLLAIGREGDARAEWSLVVRRFPGTTAATSAARLLTEPGG
jgi:tetratricopeptide (TPR) repeat protein